MSVQIIHYQDNLFSIGTTVNKIFDLFRPVLSCSAFPDTGMTPSCQRLVENEDATGPFALIFTVKFLFAARFHRKRIP